MSSYIADAHRDWHTVNSDRPWDCPLDCGIAEAYYEEEPHHIICGNCRDLHNTVEEVRDCHNS